MPGPHSRDPHSRDPRSQVLDLLAEGKITVDEAKSLLALITPPWTAGDGPGRPGRPGRPDREQRRRERREARRGRISRASFRIRVDPRVEGGADPNSERVNIRVPLALVKAGVKLTSLIPASMAERVDETLAAKGIDLDFKRLDADRLEELLADGELNIDIAEGEYRIRISLE